MPSLNKHTYTLIIHTHTHNSAHIRTYIVHYVNLLQLHDVISAPCEEIFRGEERCALFSLSEAEAQKSWWRWGGGWLEVNGKRDWWGFEDTFYMFDLSRKMAVHEVHCSGSSTQPWLTRPRKIQKHRCRVVDRIGIRFSRSCLLCVETC